jgi:hypothetical protein
MLRRMAIYSTALALPASVNASERAVRFHRRACSRCFDPCTSATRIDRLTGILRALKIPVSRDRGGECHERPCGSGASSALGPPRRCSLLDALRDIGAGEEQRLTVDDSVQPEHCLAVAWHMVDRIATKTPEQRTGNPPIGPARQSRRRFTRNDRRRVPQAVADPAPSAA